MLFITINNRIQTQPAKNMKTTQNPQTQLLLQFQKHRLNGDSLADIAKAIGIPLSQARALDKACSTDFAANCHENATRNLIKKGNESLVLLQKLKAQRDKLQSYCDDALEAGDITLYTKNLRASTLLQKEIDRLQNQQI